jgi:desulfoferrodoxin (superoxide reductase-like protein)
MNLGKIFLLYCALVLAFMSSCKDDNGVDPKVAAMYKTRDHITPQSEYTEENPREWGKLADEHVPQARLTSNKGMRAILINVPLIKPSMEHYIEKIGILDEKGKDIVSETLPRMANPRTYAYFSLQDLPADKKQLKIFAKCNLHDKWTVPLASAKWKE